MTNEKKEASSEINKNESKRKARSGIASVSFFISLFDKLGEIICNAFINGFFGKIFTCYQNLQNKLVNGLCGKALFGNHRVKKICRKVRRGLASVIDSCFFASLWKKCVNYFCSLPLNYYGNFTLFFGIYTIVVYLVKLLIPDIGAANDDYIIVGICLILAAFPMIFSKASLALSVKKSTICNLIFQGAFGFPDDAFDSKCLRVKGKGNFMLFLGLVAGTLTFFVHPLYIITAVVLLIVISLIAVSPEIGVLLTIFAVPFLTFSENPTVVLCLCVGTTAIFYLLKIIRGKRVFKLELVDIFVLIFGLYIFCSSFFSAGGAGAVDSALVCVLLLTGYFLVANLMRTEAWVKRCVLALVSSAAIVAFVGIYENFFGESNSNWLDLSLFSDIRIRVVSLFENPNILATFLVMAFPFILAIFCLSEHKNIKILSTMVGLSIVACVIFTWSRGAWLAIIIGSLLFLAIYNNKKAFRVVGLLLVMIPILQKVLPETVINRFLSIMNLSDSSISYRIYIWKGTLEAVKDHLFGGIGFGNEAFRNVYPQYSYSGIEAAEHSHSLFLQILLALGIAGLVLFAIIIFFSLQKFFEYIKKPENKTSKVYVIATVASIVSSLVMGVFDYVWYNYRVFYIFWIVIAIGCAFVRVGNYELNRKKEAIDEAE